MTRRLLALALAVLATAATAPQGRILTIDDFEDGDRRAASGLSWISISDDLMGGTSYADLTVAAPKAGASRALHVAGSVAADGFAGAWVALDGRARAVDLSDFTGIRLRVRGPKGLQVALRAGPMPGANYQATVEARPDEWRSFDVPFDSLAPARPGSPAFDRKTIRWLGLVLKQPQAGRYEFAVDDVQLYASRPDAQVRVQDGPTLATAFEAAPQAEVPKDAVCTELSRDPNGNGKQKNLPDATALTVCSDDAHGLIWFRVSLAGPVPQSWMGVNLALDTDGDPSNGTPWWGTNKAFHFDRLVTAYGLATGPGSYEGTIGIADAAEVQAGNMAGSRGERVRVVVDRMSNALVVGIPRSAVGPQKTPARVVAAVGSAFQHNDDIPNEGAATLAR